MDHFENIKLLIAETTGEEPEKTPKVNICEGKKPEHLSVKMRDVRHKAREKMKILNSSYGDAVICELTNEMMLLMHDVYARDLLILQMEEALETAVRSNSDMMDEIENLKETVHCLC